MEISSIKFSLLVITLVFCLISCKKKEPVDVSFYYWKTSPELGLDVNKELTKYSSDTLYLHFFDIHVVEKKNKKEVFPTYVIRSVSQNAKVFPIVPVIFITNESIKEADVDILSKQTDALIKQITTHHKLKKISRIQLDCDWTESTKWKYFAFIELMKEKYEVEVTIRLHQIKYPDKTGVPPVEQGILMLYNVGDLKSNENSILNENIVKQYITKNLTYSMKLKVALPLFTQTVVKNNKDKIRLMNGLVDCSDRQFFEKISENRYRAISDTLLGGFYLFKGYELKKEKTSLETIISSYQYVKESELNLNGVIFYHLSKDNLIQWDLPKLIDQL